MLKFPSAKELYTAHINIIYIYIIYLYLYIYKNCINIKTIIAMDLLQFVLLHHSFRAPRRLNGCGSFLLGKGSIQERTENLKGTKCRNLGNWLHFHLPVSVTQLVDIPWLNLTQYICIIYHIYQKNDQQHHM